MRTPVLLASVTSLALLAACQQAPTPPATAPVDDAAAVPAVTPAQPAAATPARETVEIPPGAAAPGTKDGLPDDRTPIADGKIDPKSPQGATSVIERFTIALEQKKFADATAMVSGDALALAKTFESYKEVHAEIGAPGKPDGAAGSIYVTAPVQFYGKDADGKNFRMKRYVTLRRVNDVPGSTEAQRAWHIDRIADRP